MSETLYEDDFLLWTEAQARALRGRAQGGNALDYDNLAEEVEALGRSEINTSTSLTSRILEHLYLFTCSEQVQVKGHWRAEIYNFRDDLRRSLTKTIRRRIESDLERLHVRAAKSAAGHLAIYEPFARVNPTLRWTMAEVLGDENDPAPLGDL